jgi:hypothetical protein
MMRALLLFASVLPMLHAAEPQFGQQQYTEYRPGTLPLVISAPHGGTLKPEGIPSRTLGRIAQDSHTAELATLIAQVCLQKLGGTPALIFCHLHRTKVDCNREIKEAAQGNATAEQAWREYQGFIATAQKAVQASGAKGLYIDLHGHRHPEMLVELGYLLTASQLRKLDSSMAATSGLKHLAQSGAASLEELVRGPQSLGAYLEKAGFPSIPSPSHRAPVLEQEYFSGGYNVVSHASAYGPLISGLQIECPFKGVRERPEDRPRFAKALVASLQQWWQAHYHTQLAPVGKASSR